MSSIGSDMRGAGTIYYPIWFFLCFSKAWYVCKRECTWCKQDTWI
jgi:hypothetical protein